MSVSFGKTGIVRANGGEVNPNLLKNTDFSDKVTDFTTWDTEKNGTTYAVNWGGYNGGVANPTTCYHAHLTEFQGEWVYQYTRDVEGWLGISQGGLQSIIKPNTTYTWSIDEYRTTGASNCITAGIYYKKMSDGNNAFHSGCPHGSGADLRDQWVRRVYTFTTGEVYTGSNIQFYIYGYYGGQGTIYMRRPKLELGATPTPWALADSEVYPQNNLINGLIAGGRTTVSGSTVTALLSQNQDTYFRFKCSEGLIAGQLYTLSMNCTGFLEDSNYLTCGVISQNSGKNLILRNGYCSLTFSPDSDIAAETNIIVDDLNRTTAGTLHDLQLTNIALIKENPKNVHGFIENPAANSTMRVYQSYIETAEFIEW